LTSFDRRGTQGLDKTTVGDYLGERDPFNLRVMHAFVDSMDFTSLELDDAIRLFLSDFRSGWGEISVLAALRLWHGCDWHGRQRVAGDTPTSCVSHSDMQVQHNRLLRNHNDLMLCALHMCPSVW
jgi:hypothetical protein